MRLSIAVCTLLLAAASARAADESYTIRLQRPLKVGQTFTFSATNTTQMVLAAYGPVFPDNRPSTAPRKIRDRLKIAPLTPSRGGVPAGGRNILFAMICQKFKMHPKDPVSCDFGTMRV